MLPIVITIDTEYSSGFYGRGIATDWKVNFDRTIACKSDDGDAGIFYQMDIFDRFGLKGTFFVDPIPALIWGQGAIDAIVKPIVERGHDVQLHLHSEWLQFAENSPVHPAVAKNIKDLSFADQLILLEYATDVIVKAGAPTPIAFRAGNYGANDDTLRALAKLGIAYDSSFAPGIAASDCDISLSADHLHPVEHHAVIEVPIAAISAAANRRRHGQITALSAWEMAAAMRFAEQQKWSSLVLVSHSFEMFNRETLCPNRIVMRRFEKLCRWIAENDDMDTATFSALHRNGALQPAERDKQGPQLLSHNPIRTAHRMAEQFIGNRLYG